LNGYSKDEVFFKHGNGGVCLKKNIFLKELGLFQESVRIEIHDRVVLARWIDGYPAVDMGPPTHISLHLKTDDGTFHFAHCGVPHAVQFVPDVEQVDLNLLGPRIRFHPLFSPKGANVDFAALQNDGSIRVRTFERGVEKETLACGTGAAAVAAIARELYGLKQQIPIHFRGGTLMMDGNWMIGPVRRVFSGGTGIG
jgi:diaminopimelate epimerase